MSFYISRGPNPWKDLYRYLKERERGRKGEMRDRGEVYN